MKTPTQFQDINKVLDFLVEKTKAIFTSELVGIYLTGSLSYGDFVLERSDIDLAVIIDKPATPTQIEMIKSGYRQMGGELKKWQNRIECSYIPREMLKNTRPPESPRPYYGNGIFYDQIGYGNEWLINNYFLYSCGIALFGPDFRRLARPVLIDELKKACIADFYKELEPIIRNPSCLDDCHRQSYVVLNLCRILHTVIAGTAVSKKAAARWTIGTYPEWQGLIKAANSWGYGKEMNRQDETVEFIKFAMEKLEKQKIACLNNEIQKKQRVAVFLYS